MGDRPVRVLLVEDDGNFATLLVERLDAAGSLQSEVTLAGTLGEAIGRLTSSRYDVVLLDLGLPDSSGLDTILRINDQTPDLPVVVLTGLDDETVAIRAVQKGAQDYLIKGQVDGGTLVRSMIYAIERHHLQVTVRALSTTDELTGVFNRRGFFTLCEQQLKIADRSGRGPVLLLVDLDGLKEINDTFGHHEGGKMLADAALVLRQTFRDADVIGRIGGDEFSVMAVDADEEGIAALVRRLRKTLEGYNSKGWRAWTLSLSIGANRYDPAAPCSLNELIGRADARMYHDKQSKKGRYPAWPGRGAETCIMHSTGAGHHSFLDNTTSYEAY